VAEDAFQCFFQVFDQMPAISDLNGLRCTIRGSALILLKTISTDDFNSRMLLELLGKTFTCAIRQQIDLVSF
jgi:hypothetical protein